MDAAVRRAMRTELPTHGPAQCAASVDRAMRSLRVPFLVFGAAAVIGHAQAPARDAVLSPASTGSIRGRVRTGDQGEPLRNARVQITSDSNVRPVLRIVTASP